MSRRRPSLNMKAPKMAHGDADKMADQCEAAGLPVVPWQRVFLNRMESASMSEQFDEIVMSDRDLEAMTDPDLSSRVMDRNADKIITSSDPDTSAKGRTSLD